MKTLKLLFPSLFVISLLMFNSCELDPLNPSSNPNHCKDYFENQDIIGVGLNDYKSYRNNHYELIINKAKAIISLRSIFQMTNGRIYILNSAGNYINYSSPGIDI